MSFVYNPNGTLPAPTSGATRGVAISTTAPGSPAAVFTSSNHGFLTGDYVEVEGCGVTGGDGVWQITVITPTSFFLNGSTLSGGAGSGGACYDYSVAPYYTLPVDVTDMADASSVNTPLEGISNTIPYMYRLLGKWRLFNNIITNIPANPPWTTPYSTTGPLNTAVWSNLTGMTDLFSFSTPHPIIKPGYDIVEIDCTFNIYAQTTSQGTPLAIGVALDGGSFTPITSTGQTVPPNYSTNFGGFNLRGTYQLFGGTTGQTFNFSLMAFGSVADPPTVTLAGPAAFQMKQYRPNS